MKGYQVEVRQFGDLVVAIEASMLAGREISKQDEEGVRACAHQLLAFIGDDPLSALSQPQDALHPDLRVSDVSVNPCFTRPASEPQTYGCRLSKGHSGFHDNGILQWTDAVFTVPVAQTPPPQDATTALIAKWREDARQYRADARGDGTAQGYDRKYYKSIGYDNCADELEAALKADHLAALSSQAPPQAWLRKAHIAFNVAIHRQSVIDHHLPACAGPECVICQSLVAELLPPPADRIDPSSGAGQPSSDTPRATDPNTHGWPEGKL